MRIEIHRIVPAHLGGVLAKTSENTCVILPGDSALDVIAAFSSDIVVFT